MKTMDRAAISRALYAAAQAFGCCAKDRETSIANTKAQTKHWIPRRDAAALFKITKLRCYIYLSVCFLSRPL